MNKKYKVEFQNKIYKANYANFNPQNVYTSPYVNWAFCSQPNDDDVVTQLSPFESCRESAIEHLISQTGRVALGQKKEMEKIRTDKLRVLVKQHTVTKKVTNDKELSLGSYVLHADDTIDGQMLAGLKILNLYEKEYKWPLTRAYKLFVPCMDDAPKDNRAFIYMFIGSSKWAISVPTISLFFLLIRGGRLFKCLKFDKCSDVVELEKILRSRTTVLGKGDTYYIAKSINCWSILFKHHKKIFKNLKPSINFDNVKIQKMNKKIMSEATSEYIKLRDLNANRLNRDGILRLSTFNCKHLALNAKFRQACEEDKK